MDKEMQITPESPADPRSVQRWVRPKSKRELKRIARRKAIACVINLIRNWQVDGTELINAHPQPDPDEVWAIIEWLQKRSERLRPNSQS